jgi:monoterpene epsilon-lactone hydrolase
MPSMAARVLRDQLFLLRPLVTNMSLTAVRQIQEAAMAYTAAAEDRLTRRDWNPGGMAGAVVVPDAPAPDGKVLLYLHGGGYNTGDIGYCVGVSRLLAATTGRPVYTGAYRLAPEHPFPAAPEDAYTLWKALLAEGRSPEQVTVVGESAGGGLLFALCLLLKERGEPMPGFLCAISPWVDLTLSGASYRTNRRKDPALTKRELRGHARRYAPGQEKDPLASPLFGDLAGLPPTLLTVGGNEILLDDAVRMALRLAEAGVPCEIRIEPGLWHAYPLYPIPEGRDALAKLAKRMEELP